MIQFNCRNCGTVIRAKPELAGKLGKCPKCATVNRIPPPAAIPLALPIATEGVAEPPVAREVASPMPPANFTADLPPPQLIDPDDWQSAAPAASKPIAKTKAKDKAAKVHPAVYAACCLPMLLVFVGGAIGGALGGGASAINVAVCRSRLLLTIKAALVAATSIAAVALWLVAALAINGTLFGRAGGGGGGLSSVLPSVFSGAEPVDADYCTLLLAPKVRDELKLDAPQRVRLADMARLFRRNLAHPMGFALPGMGNSMIPQAPVPHIDSRMPGLIGPRAPGIIGPMGPRNPGFIEPTMPQGPDPFGPLGLQGPGPLIIDAPQRRAVIESSLKLNGGQVKVLLRESQDRALREMFRSGTLRPVVIQQHGKSELDPLFTVNYTPYKEDKNSVDHFEEVRKPDGSTEMRFTSHESFTDEEVLEQIRSPADAVAVLEAGDKDVAIWGRRWLLRAKVTAEDRSKVTAALKRYLDTPDAGQRLDFVRAYCRWSVGSPDVPALLTILRFPSQYHDCWWPAFAIVGTVSHPAARQIVEERQDEPSFGPTIFGQLGDLGAKAVPLLKWMAKSKVAAVREAAEAQLGRLGIHKKTASAEPERKPAEVSKPEKPRLPERPETPRRQAGPPDRGALVAAKDGGHKASEPASEPAAKRLPAPDADALAAAMKLVKDLYGEEYKAAKSVAEKQALAKKLRGLAGSSKDDPAGYFVLLRLSRDISTQACDGQAAFEAIDAMDRAFQVDAPAMKMAVLTKFTTAAGKAEDHKSIAEAAIGVLDEAMDQDNFSAAAQLQAMALGEARKASDSALVRRVSEYGDEIKSLAQIYEAVQAATETLKAAADDPGANLTVGKYKCFWKGDWQRGLAALALGNDPELKSLAKKEMQGVASADGQAELGDDWWDLAGKQGAWARKKIEGRAGYWYQKALPGLGSGLAKAKVEKRLQKIAAGPGNVAHARKAISKIVIWNEHNSFWNNSGTDVCNLILQKSGSEVRRYNDLKIPWVADRDMYLAVPIPRLVADTVRVEIVQRHGNSGGLAEIEVFSGKENIARNCPVATSGNADEARSGKSLTDGVTTSGEHQKGYWILPDGQSGWAEIQLEK